MYSFFILVFGILILNKIWFAFIRLSPIKTDIKEHSDSTNNIKLLSWNIYLVFVHMIKEGRFFQNDELSRATKLFAEHDIICLQECFTTFNLHINSFLKEMNRLGFNYYLPQKPTLTKFIDSGLMILSRYPIINAKFEEFKDACYADRFSMKGIQYIKIALDNSNHLEIINTHLQASFSLNDPLGEKIRISQLYQIRKFIDKNCQNANRLVICGDFNFIEDSPEYELIKTLFSEYRDIIKPPLINYSPYFPKYDMANYNPIYTTKLGMKNNIQVLLDEKEIPDKALRYDYIFTGLLAQDIRIIRGGHFHSDHYPISFNIRSF